MAERHGGDPNHLRPSWDDPPRMPPLLQEIAGVFRGFIEGTMMGFINPLRP